MGMGPPSLAEGVLLGLLPGCRVASTPGVFFFARCWVGCYAEGAVLAVFHSVGRGVANLLPF